MAVVWVLALVMFHSPKAAVAVTALCKVMRCVFRLAVSSSCHVVGTQQQLLNCMWASTSSDVSKR
jgi:hypothetical protein